MKKQYTFFIPLVNLFSVLIVLNLCTLSTTSAQNNFGVTFHQSSDTRLGMFCEIKNRFIFETRILDLTLAEDLSIEFLGFYSFYQDLDYETYAGLGYSLSPYLNAGGLVLAIGTNIYPFKNKNFGFHFEFNPIVPEDIGLIAIIRGSWGLRYKFLNNNQQNED